MQTPDLVPHIPESARRAFANPAAPGHRHEEMKTLACILAAQNFAASAIFAQLREMYGADVSDKEITDLVEWAKAQDFEPTRPVLPRARSRRRRFSGLRNRQNEFSPAELAEKFLDGYRCSPEQVSKASPVQVPENCSLQTALAVESLYSPDEAINIVTDYNLEGCGDGEVKAKPKGRGRTKKRKDWLALIGSDGPPESQGGAWLRMNPLDGRGVTDRNVTAFRYCLLESDTLSEDLQISLLAKLRLPIAIIISSGGRSFHAWLRVNAQNEEEYKGTVKAIAEILAPFGFDSSNKNPGRLSRLPGAKRTIGAHGDGVQKLIYLNPAPNGSAIL